MDTTPSAATDSLWADVDVVLASLADTHGSTCLEWHEGLVRKAHAEFLAESGTAEEFEMRFGDWLIDLVGTTPG